MRPQLTQQAILDALVAEVRNIPDQPIRDVTTGVCLTAVSSRFLGLASLVSHIAPGTTRREAAETSDHPSVHEAAALLLDPASTNTDKATLAIAAVNSLLPPPDEQTALPGQDIALLRGRGKNVAVVGHFPFVDDLRSICANLWVLEKKPQPGDVDASKAGEILPQADLVAVTGTTLLNGTLAGLLNSCRPDTFVVMLGPTTPFAWALFDCGIDVLAGCAVPDPEAALVGIRAGKCFKGLAGVRQTAWAKPGVVI
jgi:uncharacterized protein